VWRLDGRVKSAGAKEYFVTVQQKIQETAPQIKTVRAEGEWKGNYRTDLDVRDFRFVIAEPEKIGGKNEGPTPMEYVLGALNGCLNVVIELVAKERGIALRDLHISSSGLVDQRGLFGTADVSPQFQSVDVNVTGSVAVPVAQLADLQQTVLKRCPVYNLIRDSKARIDVTWNLKAEG
jgi:uncharacterized OsmC-like protein